MSSDVHSKEDSFKHLNNEKPCRTCMDFRSWMKLHSNIKKTETAAKDKNSEGQGSNAIQTFNIPLEEEYGGSGGRRKTSQHKPVKTYVDQDDEYHPNWGMAAKYGCPADSLSLGRGTWRLLHSIGAYYPDSPSNTIQDDMKNFIGLFSKFYPCQPCAEDFREWIKNNPPDVSSKSTISKWFCVAHNEVNKKLDKPEFDCNLLDQKWLDGWKDGSCD